MTTERHAALFDVDKTLHDSDEFIIASFEFALRTHGLTVPPRSEIGKLLGRTLSQTYLILAPEFNQDILRDLHQQFQKAHPELLHAFPDTIPTLAKIRSAGILTAAVTSRTSDSAKDNLRKTGVSFYLDLVVTKEDVISPKPDPEGILKVLDSLKVKPKNAWMTGDAPEDIQAGRNAGVFTIGYSVGFPSPELIESKPHALVNKLSEVVPIIANKVARLRD